MDLLKTEKEQFSTDEIEAAIQEHERVNSKDIDATGNRDRCAWLWRYYRAKNKGILTKPDSDPNNPNNKIPVPYGRKIVTTFTGYAYRPGYITYKADDQAHAGYLEQLQATLDLSDEPIKTERAGRNTAIYGYAYELLYIDGVDTDNPVLPLRAEPRFFSVDPAELMLFYDYAPEPAKQLAVRYYRITDDLYKVEQYTRTMVLLYDRKRLKDQGVAKWVYTLTGEKYNFFEAVPVVAYYFSDDRLGLIEPVLPLCDAYDVLVSGGMDEFERFANAYLLMVNMGLVSPELKKEPGAFSRALQFLRKFRVFEHLPDKDAVSFLTKDIPTGYLEYMSKQLKQDIHDQSHVPDFRELATGTLSGAAIKRMLFDFENVASSAEADFNLGLYERIRLINTIYAKTGRIADPERSVIISHKRNLPDDLTESAETARTLKEAGFSAWLVADSMPDAIIPDNDEELARQKAEREEMFDVDREPIVPDDTEDDPNEAA